MKRMTVRKVKGGIFVAAIMLLTMLFTHMVDVKIYGKDSLNHVFYKARWQAYQMFLRDKCPTAYKAFDDGYRAGLYLNEKQREIMRKRYKV